MENPITIAEPDSSSLNSLRIKIESVKGEINSLFKIDQLFPKTIETKEQELIARLKTELTRDTNGIKQIFLTEKGSTYFVLDSGESFRIQQKPDELVLQPIFNNIFFVDPVVAEELKTTHRSWYSTKSILNRPIPTANCAIGSFPIEFGIVKKPEIGFVRASHTITILGDKDGDFSSGSHIGHSIVKILK